MSKAKRRRAYDGTKRQEAAKARQERVIEVATRLFAERGYAETTVDMIAAEAEVAVPTVYASFGSKRGLLSQILDRLVTGESRPRPILQTARARDVLDEPDPRRALALFAEHMTEIQARVGPLFEVMKHAARTDAEVSELHARAQRSRYQNLEAVARMLDDRGGLRPGLTVASAARTIWVIASPETRQMLEAHAGWSADDYRTWLTDTLLAALLAPEPPSP
ncbi:MAG: helix-turn-helix domain-containing protein [Polyangiaceae bacterium]